MSRKTRHPDLDRLCKLLDGTGPTDQTGAPSRLIATAVDSAIIKPHEDSAVRALAEAIVQAHARAANNEPVPTDRRLPRFRWANGPKSTNFYDHLYRLQHSPFPSLNGQIATRLNCGRERQRGPLQKAVDTARTADQTATRQDQPT